MLINYAYEKAIKVFMLWLSKALLHPKREVSLQWLWIGMEARQITPAFNPERMDQYVTPVFKRLTSGYNSTGNIKPLLN